MVKNSGEAGGTGGSLSSRVLRAFKRHGAIGFLRLVLANLGYLMSGKMRHHQYIYDESFDREHGINTLGVVEVDEMEGAADLPAASLRYEPAEPAFFNFVLSRSSVDEKEQHLFIDIGSGKGRTLVLAAQAGFHRAIGVEIDPALHASANENIARVAERFSSTKFELLNEDAAAFAFPEVATILLLNNPFGPPILLPLLERLEQSLSQTPRSFLLIYMHAFHADEINTRGQWELLDQGVFQVARKPYAIYRWRGPQARRTVPLDLN